MARITGHKNNGTGFYNCRIKDESKKCTEEMRSLTGKIMGLATHPLGHSTKKAFKLINSSLCTGLELSSSSSALQVFRYLKESDKRCRQQLLINIREHDVFDAGLVLVPAQSVLLCAVLFVFLCAVDKQ